MSLTESEIPIYLHNQQAPPSAIFVDIFSLFCFKFHNCV